MREREKAGTNTDSSTLRASVTICFFFVFFFFFFLRGAAAGHGRQKMRMSRTKSTFTSRPQNCRSKTVGQPKQPKIYRMSRTKYMFVSHPQNCRSKTIKKGRSAKQNSGCLARNTHLYRECRTVDQKRSGSRTIIGCLARNTWETTLRAKTVGQSKKQRMSRTKYTFISRPQNCRSKRCV